MVESRVPPVRHKCQWCEVRGGAGATLVAVTIHGMDRYLCQRCLVELGRWTWLKEFEVKDEDEFSLAIAKRARYLEAISAKVHEQWTEAKRLKGVTSRKLESGEELMVAYEQLSEDAKELDRGSVRAVLAAIQSLDGNS